MNCTDSVAVIVNLRQLYTIPELIGQIPKDIDCGQHRRAVVQHNGRANGQRRHQPVVHHPAGL